MGAGKRVENTMTAAERRLGERISNLVDTFSSRRAAARVAGVSTEQLRRYLAGATPRLDVVARLCEAAGWSIDYVWSGRATNFVPGSLAGIVLDDCEDGCLEQSDLQFFDKNSTANYPFHRDWLCEKGWDPEYLAFVIWRGHSLSGMIDDGQLVLINLDDHDIYDGGLFAFRLGNYLSIKMVQVGLHGHIVLRASNPDFRELIIPRTELDQLKIIGRAVLTERTL